MKFSICCVGPLPFNAFAAGGGGAHVGPWLRARVGHRWQRGQTRDTQPAAGSAFGPEPLPPGFHGLALVGDETLGGIGVRPRGSRRWAPGPWSPAGAELSSGYPMCYIGLAPWPAKFSS